MCITSGETHTRSVCSIPEFYAGKNVFITGATGFIGKALVEKLLRSCPNIGIIYVLIRPKRGKELMERVQHFIKDQLYDRLKREQPELKFDKKIIPLAGDMMQLNLGLSTEDRKIITESVSVIFHAAATVRFDEPLKNSVILNVRGTREVCNLALDTKKLEAYVHVSTAFANCDRMEAEEILYTPKADWKKTIHLVENMDSDVLNVIAEKFIGNMPNTYCFTKNLAEHAVYDLCKGKIPVKICRPSIVVSTLREEPIAGWVENFNGPLGILIAYGKGIMRTVYANKDYKPDYIPVDILTKALIVSAWDLSQRRFLDPEIVQCTSHTAQWIRPTIAELAKHGTDILNEQLPLNDILWVPSTHTTNNTLVCYVRTVLCMLLPSMLLDGALQVCGKKPRLLKLQKKMFIAQLALRYFMNNEWNYPNDNLLALQKRIPSEDHSDWDYEFMHYDLKTYLTQGIYGLRRHLLNEPDDTLPKARVHYKRMKMLHQLLQVVIWCGVLYVLWKTNIVQSLTSQFMS